MSKFTVHNLYCDCRLGRWGIVTMTWAVAVALMVAVAGPIAARAQETAPTAAPMADVSANDDAPDSPPPPATETPVPLLTPVPAASAAPTVAPSPIPMPAPPANPTPVGAEASSSVAPAAAPNAANPAAASPAVPAGAPPAAASASPAAAGSSSTNGNDGKVIHPVSGLSALFGGGSSASGSASGGGSASGKTAEPPSATSLAFSFLALLGFCALGLVLMRRRLGFSVPGIKGQRKLVVSETRALGNRQFLLVVEYENQRVLLGVTPGKIDYLCELTPPVSAGSAEAGAAPATEKDYGALIDQAKARQTS